MGKIRAVRKIRVAVVGLMLFSSVAFAADWVPIVTDSDQNNWSYDNETMFRNGDLVRVWVQLEAGERRKAELKQAFSDYAAVGTLSYERWQFEIFCVTNMFRVTRVHIYDTKGTLWLSEKYLTDPFLKAVPRTPIFHLIEAVCKPTKNEASAKSRP